MEGFVCKEPSTLPSLVEAALAAGRGIMNLVLIRERKRADRRRSGSLECDEAESRNTVNGCGGGDGCSVRSLLRSGPETRAMADDVC